MKLDGFYQDRKDGLLAVLRLVNCNPLADNIEAALDTHIGSSTFYQMQNDYRDKNIAHPQFRMNLQADFVDRMKRNLTSAAHIEAFCNADDELKACTAAAYVWLADHYPQLLEDANAADRLVDNPPSSEI